MEHRKIKAENAGNDNVHQADLIRGRLESALRLVDQLAGTQRPAAAVQASPVTEHSIRALLRLRRSRAHFFDEELFADPAWDMLLELYAAELGQFRVSITSLSAAASVPGTTALRWIGVLERKGLINRRPDPMDGRRYFMELSATGLKAMEDYFRTVPIGAQTI